MILEKVGYSYNDLKIVPAVISRVDSRSQCNPYDENGMLTIFASCMSTVVDTKNYEIFKQNKITPIIPTTIDLVSREILINEGEWVALSMDEFKKMFVDNEVKPNKTYKVCVDIANGHMLSLYKLCQKAKELSYLNKDEQELVYAGITYNDLTPSHGQAIKIRELSKNKKLRT